MADAAEYTAIPTFVEAYHNVQDKTAWGDGPWQSEPDKVVWVDTTSGLDCMINRGPAGALCGYVGVSVSHPWHGKGYSECLDHGEDCEDRWEHRSPGDVSVHGGLTFADGCQKSDDPSKHVCHVPQAGRPDPVWWFGFDCVHFRDVSPRMRADDRRRYETAKAEGDAEGMRIWRPEMDPYESYKDLAYVVREVQDLAKQLANV